MATRTKFQDVRAALASAFTTQLASDAVTATVTEYPPLGDYAREDRVWLGNIRFRQTPYTFDRYEETLDVDLVVDCPTSGGTVSEYAAGEQRAETIFDSLLETLRTDITVGAVTFNVELDETDSTVEVVDETGPHGRIEASLSVEVHIGA